tara:strand:+ start:1535 stop:3088 length:1554 start_codon:yes stop_codon:yes gene_type:complete
MVKILDHLGNPIKKNVMVEEIAGPSMTGVRQHFDEHVTHGLTPRHLASILRNAESGDPHDYLGMAEELEEKDLHYLSVMGTRKRAVSQLEMTVEPASDDANDEANADLVREFLNRDDVEDLLFDILDAVGKGYSVSEIVWETSEKQWLPCDIIWRDPRWFEFDPIDRRTLMLKERAELVPLQPYKFVYHTHKSKSGLPIRGGLARSVAWAWMFKNFGVKDWVIFAEVYGQPIRVGKYGPNATEDERRVLLRAVANIGTDAAAIIPESMMIEFIKADSAGSSDLYERLCNWMDYQISKAVLGQTTTTDAVSGGHAVAKEHNEVREDIERSDSKQLSATLNQTLVKYIIDLNRGPQKRYPKIRLGRSEYTDISKLSTALNILVPLGLKVSESEIRSKVGLKEPDSDDDILTPIKAETPPVEEKEPEKEPPIKKAAQSQTSGHQPDEIEKFTTQAISEDDLLSEAAKITADIINDADSLEALRDKLIYKLDDMPQEELVDHLAKSGFFARIAGDVENEVG